MAECRCNECNGAGDYEFTDGWGAPLIRSCPWCTGTGIGGKDYTCRVYVVRKDGSVSFDVLDDSGVNVGMLRMLGGFLDEKDLAGKDTHDFTTKKYILTIREVQNG